MRGTKSIERSDLWRDSRIGRLGSAFWFCETPAEVHHSSHLDNFVGLTVLDPFIYLVGISFWQLALRSHSKVVFFDLRRNGHIYSFDFSFGPVIANLLCLAHLPLHESFFPYP